MASWGNQADNQYQQDMDSAGHKLNVNGNSGGGNNFQAEFADTNAQGNAVKVVGKVRIDRTAAIHSGTIKGATGIDPEELQINVDAGEPSVVIGHTGNNLHVRANKSYIGVTAGAPYNTALKGPAKVDGDVGTTNLTVVGNAEVQNALSVGMIDALGSTHTNLTVGAEDNSGTLHLGTHASNIMLAEQGGGAVITMRGGVTVTSGTTNPAGLDVAGHISATGPNGHLGATGNLGVTGQTTLFGQLDALGNVNVGTAQQPRTTTLNGPLVANGNVTVGTTQQPRTATVKGQVDVSGGLTVGGALYADAVKAHNGDSVKFSSSVGLTEKLDVEGYSTFNNITAHLAGINFNTAGIIPFNGIRFQNNRFEFYIAGVLHFYIDITGGHDA